MSPSKKYSLGDKVADKVAQFGGSWAAIISCTSIIAIWIVLNSFILVAPVDPYPYILLNLILSCVAALQAPFIIMANARQALQDRKWAKEDLDAAKKTELEVREVLAKLEVLERKVDAVASQLRG
jgi:uncharacterized membrane protein